MVLEEFPKQESAVGGSGSTFGDVFVKFQPVVEDYAEVLVVVYYRISSR